jgi:Tfp pilus assembly protein PilF
VAKRALFFKTTKIMKKLVIIFLVTTLFSCKEKPVITITSVKDYAALLDKKTNINLENANKEKAFWNNRLKKDSLQLISLAKLGNVYTTIFNETGNIEALKNAEQVLTKAVNVAAIGRESYQRALAQNYISQHRFSEAKEVLKKALLSVNNQDKTKMLLFDVSMELGNFKKAKEYLDAFKDLNSFNYLIRLAKWSDHQGNLNSAIKYMEKAKSIAVRSNNSNLKAWSYSNLGDFYGHAGNIEQSYNYYLQTLDVNPNHSHALKGIAWIIFSYERNPKKALEILNFLTAHNKSPDLLLLKADIHEFLNNSVQKEESITSYFKEVANPKYGSMYTTHSIPLMLNKNQLKEEGLFMALNEVESRATPDNYALLAWAHFKNKNYHLALKIIEQNVEGKTFEPQSLFYSAQIYKANNAASKLVKPLKKELSQSIYELGPLLEEPINKL